MYRRRRDKPIATRSTAADPTDIPTICAALRLLLRDVVCSGVVPACADESEDEAGDEPDGGRAVPERGGAVRRRDSVKGVELCGDVVGAAVGSVAVFCPPSVVVTVLVDWVCEGMTCAAIMVACVSKAALLRP